MLLGLPSNSIDYLRSKHRRGLQQRSRNVNELKEHEKNVLVG